MTNRTAEPVQHNAGDAAPPGHAGVSRQPDAVVSDADQSIRHASLVAGVGLLLMSALAGFGNFVAIEGLVTQGDASRTAADIIASEGMFRLGIAAWFLIVALDVVIAWALFRVFRPVSTGVSRLAAWFRLVYAGVLLVAVSELVAALRLLGDDAYLTVFSTDQLQAHALLRIETFTDTWDAGLLLFGLHLLLLGYLAYRSGYVPRWLGVLLAIAGLGYVFDTSATLLLSQGLPVSVSTFTFIGEFLLAVWLVTRGRRITLTRFHQDPVALAE